MVYIVTFFMQIQGVNAIALIVWHYLLVWDFVQAFWQLCHLVLFWKPYNLFIHLDRSCMLIPEKFQNWFWLEMQANETNN